MCGFLKRSNYLQNIIRTYVNYIGCTHIWDFIKVKMVKSDTFYGLRSTLQVVWFPPTGLSFAGALRAGGQVGHLG